MKPTDHNTVAGSGTGYGQRLRAAREAAGHSVSDVASRLKMPIRIVEALEADAWTSIGAPVFVRGQLRSYARLLGLPAEPVSAASSIAPIEPTRLVSRTRTPRVQRIAEQVGRRVVYVVITAVLVTPVWYYATQSRFGDLEDTASLDLPGDAPTAVGVPARPSSAADEPSTVVASMASMPPRGQAQAPILALDFAGDSWVKILAPDGQVIEEALLHAGERRRFAAGEVGRVVLGNASTVDARSHGRALDLAPYMRANVARFTVSSDGSLTPAGN